ncbi:protein enhancer of rudimentary-like [Scaptodrosophila lebanonensis]|uniref:Protein enhancer of rudimentary-like n=1 Tax=Drosophila lebanonensis TaxID=7225 RepID=A0A6J2TVN8_DROLE|nr:protein enhancer of rudimentary-like [Scaptodrosophila lebanonensis]
MPVYTPPMHDGSVLGSSPVILLLESSEGNIFCTYDNIYTCIEALCKFYEDCLLNQYPDAQTITYNTDQLFDFLAVFTDLCCLVYQEATQSYVAHNRAWIFWMLYEMLLAQLNEQ